MLNFVDFLPILRMYIFNLYTYISNIYYMVATKSLKIFETVEGLLETLDNAEVIVNKLTREMKFIKNDDTKIEIISGLEDVYNSIHKLEKRVVDLYDSVNVKYGDATL